VNDLAGKPVKLLSIPVLGKKTDRDLKPALVTDVATAVVRAALLIDPEGF